MKGPLKRLAAPVAAFTLAGAAASPGAASTTHVYAGKLIEDASRSARGLSTVVIQEGSRRAPGWAR